MSSITLSALFAVVCLLYSVTGFGQTRWSGVHSADDDATIARPVETDSPGTGTTVAAGPQTVVPHLMKFSGALRDLAGNPLTGTVDVTFSLYSTEAGGEPLWFETQSVQADELGRYTSLLGAMHPDGLPIDLFTSGEVHWLGIQVGLEAEQQPRVLLVSVPYALMAGDAETLGGKPASAYVLADTQKGTASAITTTALTAAAAQTGTSGATENGRKTNVSPLTSCSVTSGGSATVNSIALFTTACNIESANIFQSSSNVGIGTASPQASLQIGSGFGSYSGFKLVTWDSVAQAGVAIGYSGAANSIQGRSGSDGGNNSNLTLNPYGGNVGIGTTNPQASLHIGSPQASLQIGSGFGSYSGFKLVTWDSVAQEGIAIGYFGAANSIQGRSGSDGGNNSNLTLNPYGGNVGIGTTTPAAMLEVNGTAKFDGAATFTAGNVGIGTSAPAAKLDVNGTANFSGAATFAAGQTVTGTVSATSFMGSGALITGIPNSALSTAAQEAQTRGIVYLAGCDSCGVLGLSDSQVQFYVNVIGNMTINSVQCFSDNNGTTTINIARHNGGPTPLLMGPLTCNGSSTSSFTSSALNLNDQLDFVMGTPDNAARRITVAIKATLN